jgi:outer membrane protein
MRKSSVVLSITFLAAIPFQAIAQEQQPRPKSKSDGWEVSVGGGGFVSPQYLGDDDYVISAVPYIRITKGERFTATIEDGARYTVVNSNGFQAGPLAKINFGRDEDGSGNFLIDGDDTQDLLGLGDIDTTVEIGGFVEYDFDKFALSAEGVKGLGGHDGVIGRIGLRYKNRLTGYGPPLIYSIGPSIDFGDDRYVGAYFGVDPDQSTASGLPEFDARGGILSYGVGGTAILPLTETISATFIVSYKRLSGDAADAPLVTERGSKDQAFAGAFLAYTF